jgi:hypothetical protein
VTSQGKTNGAIVVENVVDITKNKRNRIKILEEQKEILMGGCAND